MDKCPVCSSTVFFIRDPEDEYEMYRFEVTSKGCVFEDELDAESALFSGRKIFCDQCSWHGEADQLPS